MNAIASLTRHFLTCLAGLGGFLFAHGVIPENAVAQADAAGAALMDPLAVICGLLTAAAVRLAIFCLGKIFPVLAEKLGSQSGMAGLLLMGLAAAAVGGSLPSCQALAGVPVKATVFMQEGALSYSSKRGVNMEYRPGYGEMPGYYRSNK